jgi:Holliday junction resolvase RusA-like endonuclease
MTPDPASPVTFFVAGAPVPWRPPRVTLGGSHTYSPAHVRAWQQTVAVHARVAMAGKRPLEGPVELRLVFTRRPTRARPDEVFWSQRPDWVNLTKAIEDSLNNIVFLDDNQVVCASVLKVRGEKDGVRISVKPAVLCEVVP